MSDTKEEMLTRVARSPAQLDQVRQLDAQLRELERQGVFDRGGYALSAPLSGAAYTPQSTFANADEPDV